MKQTNNSLVRIHVTYRSVRYRAPLGAERGLPVLGCRGLPALVVVGGGLVGVDGRLSVMGGLVGIDGRLSVTGGQIKFKGIQIKYKGTQIKHTAHQYKGTQI